MAPISNDPLPDTAADGELFSFSVIASWLIARPQKPVSRLPSPSILSFRLSSFSARIYTTTGTRVYRSLDSGIISNSPRPGARSGDRVRIIELEFGITAHRYALLYSLKARLRSCRQVLLLALQLFRLSQFPYLILPP